MILWMRTSNKCNQPHIYISFDNIYVEYIYCIALIKVVLADIITTLSTIYWQFDTITTYTIFCFGIMLYLSYIFTSIFSWFSSTFFYKTKKFPKQLHFSRGMNNYICINLLLLSHSCSKTWRLASHDWYIFIVLCFH